jgi:hypothetical protein
VKDHLAKLALEVLGEGAVIEAGEQEGMLVLRAVAGKALREVTVPAGPKAEEEARSRLHAMLLGEQGRQSRQREWRADIDEARERSHPRLAE